MTFIALTQVTWLKMAKKHGQDVSHRKWPGLETVGTSEKMNTDSQVMGFGSWLAGQSCRRQALCCCRRGEAAREGQERLHMWVSADSLKVGRQQAGLITQQL